MSPLQLSSWDKPMPFQLEKRRPPEPAPRDVHLDDRSRRGGAQADGYDAQAAALSFDAPIQLQGDGPAGPEVAKVAGEGLRGGGGALPHGDQIQRSFGHHDVGGVEAHVGADASRANERLGASGYATGDQVAFKGRPDLFTAAHEAAHVVQQRGGVSVPGGVGARGDRYERHADSVAERVVQGRSAQDLLDQVARPESGAAPAGGATQFLINGDPLLSSSQAARALRYNRGRGYPATTWQSIASAVGSPTSAMEELFMQHIAGWQESKGLDHDGMVGRNTLGQLRNEPGFSGGGQGGATTTPTEDPGAGGSGQATDGPLSEARVARAVRYNRGRGYSAEVWAGVARVVGAAGAAISEQLVQKIAAWQIANGSGDDGMVGPTTLRNLRSDAAFESGGQSGASSSGNSGATTTTGGGGQTTEPEGPLSTQEARNAISYMQRKGLSQGALQQIAGIIGAPSAAINAGFVQKAATWQAAMGLDADGKLGDISMQWLSQQPGGKGLERHVKSNAVMYVGLNPQSVGSEIRTIKGRAGSRNVTAISGTEETQGKIDVAGDMVDLSTEEGLQAFIGSLSGLDPGKKDRLKSWLEKADFMAKDELAQMARHLAKAETGKALIKRVILSGHSGGWSFWGDDNGYVPFDSLAELPKIFPIACGQPEDLMLSACNTGQSGKLDQYKEIFPNLKSIWAYVGYSPSAASGALKHIGKWEEVTRGAMNADKMHQGREQIAGGSGRRDKNVAVYTNDGSGQTTYATASPEAQHDYETMRAVVDDNMVHYNKAYDDGHIDRTILNDFYTKLQALVGMFRHRLGGEAAKYETIMKRTLYLRYWDNISKKFMEHHGSAVKRGYEGAGAQTPAYATMARDQTLREIGAYPGSRGDEAHKLLTQYLRDLDPNVVPDNWA